MILDWPVPQLSTQLLHSPEIESWSFMTTLTLAWLPETTDSDLGKYSQHVDVDVLWGIKTARLINCALRIWSLHAANMCHNTAMISRTIIRLIVGDQIFHSTKIVLQWFPILSPWISSLNLPSTRKNKGIMYFCKCGDNTTFLVKKDVAGTNKQNWWYKSITLPLFLSCGVRMKVRLPSNYISLKWKQNPIWIACDGVPSIYSQSQPSISSTFDWGMINYPLHYYVEQ